MVTKYLERLKELREQLTDAVMNGAASEAEYRIAVGQYQAFQIAEQEFRELIDRLKQADDD